MEYLTFKKIINKSVVQKGFKNFLNVAEEFGLKKSNQKYLKNNWSNEELHKHLIKLKKEQFSKIYDNFSKSSIIYDILISNELYSLAANFLNIDMNKLVLYNSYLRMDKPHDTKHILDWHSDDMADGKKGCTIWCPLINVNTHNGTIKILPGSTKESFFLSQIEKKKAKDINLSQGDMLVFNTKLLHRSGANKSNQIRFVLIYHFFEI